MSSNITTEEFLLRFDNQFRDAQVLAYIVFLPIFCFFIFFAAIGGLLQRQKFVLYGVVFSGIIIAWNFGFMGSYLGWIENSAREECFFDFEGLEVNICFCELYQTFQQDINVEETLREERLSKLVVQPASTISNLAFVSSGILILFIASYPLKRIKSRSRVHKFIKNIRDNGNPMAKENSFISLAYGLVVIFIGPASMIFHASLTIWYSYFLKYIFRAGIIDVVGILVWVSYCIAYSASQLFFHDTEFHRDEHTFTTRSLFIVLFVFLTTVAACWYIGNGQQSTPLYITYFVLLVFLEATVQWYEHIEQPYNGVKRDTTWLVCAVVSITVAIVIWAPSGGITNTLCPSYWPHATWHILASFSTFFLYLYYCSEVDLQEVKEGRIRARSVRTKRLQDQLGFNFDETVLKYVEERDSLRTSNNKQQTQASDENVTENIVVDMTDIALVTKVNESTASLVS